MILLNFSLRLFFFFALLIFLIIKSVGWSLKKEKKKIPSDPLLLVELPVDLLLFVWIITLSNNNDGGIGGYSSV